MNFVSQSILLIKLKFYCLFFLPFGPFKNEMGVAKTDDGFAEHYFATSEKKYNMRFQNIIFESAEQVLVR